MKQKRRDGLKRIIVGISALILALTVLGESRITVHAASQNDVLGLLLGQDDEGEAVFAVPAFVIISETDCVLFSGIFSEDAEEITFITGAGNTLDIGGIEKTANNDFFLWPLGDVDRDLALSDPSFLNWTNPIQNENANVIYWTIDSSDEFAISSENVRIKDLEDHWLDVEGLPDDIVAYPAPVLNEDGQLLAVVTKEDTIFTLFDVDQEVFYGGSSDSVPDSNGSGNSERDSGTDGYNGGYERNSDDGTKKFYQEVGGQMGEILFSIALLAIGVTALVLVLKKRKKGGGKPPVSSEPYVAYNRSPIIEDIEETRPVDDIGPTLPVEGAGAVPVQTKDLRLAARGGYMDGRSYFVGKEGIRIGRDISNEIHYPRETRGVSRTHCQLYWDRGRLMIMDCNSTSGTFVKGAGQLQPMKPKELKEGDIFYVGEKNNGFQIIK